MELFRHMCNFSSCKEGLRQAKARERGVAADMAPSDFLDCAVAIYTILGYILEDSKGEGAK
eukprot:4741149-Ditylum_brightwellii.AAC.1